MRVFISRDADCIGYFKGAISCPVSYTSTLVWFMRGRRGNKKSGLKETISRYILPFLASHQTTIFRVAFLPIFPHLFTLFLKTEGIHYVLVFFVSLLYHLRMCSNKISSLGNRKGNPEASVIYSSPSLLLFFFSFSFLSNHGTTCIAFSVY